MSQILKNSLQIHTCIYIHTHVNIPVYIHKCTSYIQTHMSRYLYIHKNVRHICRHTCQDTCVYTHINFNIPITVIFKQNSFMTNKIPGSMFIYTYIYVCIYIYIYIYIYIRVCVHAHVPTYQWQIVFQIHGKGHVYKTPGCICRSKNYYFGGRDHARNCGVCMCVCMHACMHVCMYRGKNYFGWRDHARICGVCMMHVCMYVSV